MTSGQTNEHVTLKKLSDVLIFSEVYMLCNLEYGYDSDLYGGMILRL